MRKGVVSDALRTRYYHHPGSDSFDVAYTNRLRGMGAVSLA